MTIEEHHPAWYWEEILGIRVLDQDGWRASATPWHTPLTRAEFEARAAVSTCEHLARPVAEGPPGAAGGSGHRADRRPTDQGETGATALDGTSPPPRSPGTLDAAAWADRAGIPGSAPWAHAIEAMRDAVEERTLQFPPVSTALVGPLTPVTFYPGRYAEHPVTMWFDMPKDTADPVAAGCLNHHLACRCREASLEEAWKEARAEAAEARSMDRALGAVVRLHTPDREDWENQPRCGECHNPWPCPTFDVAAEAARYAAHRARAAAAARFPAYRRQLRREQLWYAETLQAWSNGEAPF